MASRTTCPSWLTLHSVSSAIGLFAALFLEPERVPIGSAMNIVIPILVIVVLRFSKIP